MRAVIQRVNEARVRVKGKIISEIGRGLLVLLGVGIDDKDRDIEYMADKIVNLRIFSDESGKFNLSLKDINGEILIVSQFTLWGDCRKGRRPSFIRAAPPDRAIELYEKFVHTIGAKGFRVGTGEFGAMMEVELINDGPVTILLDSEKIF